MESSSSPYMLMLLEDNSEILRSPLGASQRVMYTSFDASARYIVLGATSGSLYVFSRTPLTYLHLIPTTEGCITHVCISPDEKFVAFATKKNVVCVVELQDDASGKLVARSQDFSDAEVTTLKWGQDNCLFVGDSAGRLSSIKLLFLSKAIFNVPTFLLIKLDSTIVQIDVYQHLLVVSTLTRCYFCDTVKQFYKSIGEKSRHGIYGACFATFDHNVKIFCARPGSRLWEVNLDGVVHSTQEFKKALAIRPSIFVSLFECTGVLLLPKEDDEQKWPVQSLNFKKLCNLLGKYIFTFKEDSIYIFDVETACVLMWANIFTNISDALCLGSSIFLWTERGLLLELIVVPLEQCVLKLYFKNQYNLCADLISLYKEKLLKSEVLWELRPLRDLLEHLSPVNEFKDIEEFIDKLGETLQSCERSVKYDSGVVVVDNNHFSKQLANRRLPVSGIHQREHLSLDRIDMGIKVHKLSRLPLKAAKVQEIDSESTEHEASGLQNGDISSEIMESRRGYSRMPDIPFNRLITDVGSYHTPFITVASYEILQDSMTELGVTFTEILNTSSKTIFEKLESLHQRLNPFKKDENSSFSPIMETATDALDHINENSDDEYGDIVFTQNQRLPEVDVAQIEAVVETAVFADSDTKTKMMYKFLDTIVQQYSDYRVASVECGVRPKEYFPFKAYFPQYTMDRIQSNIHFILDNRLLNEWLLNTDDVEIDVETFEQYYPSLLKTLYTREEIKIDIKCRQFVSIFSELIDKYSILEHVKRLCIPCYYLTFTYVLDFFQNMEANYSKEKEKEWPLAVYLNAMLLMLSLDQINAFCQMGIKRKINLKDISYLILVPENRTSEAPRLENVFLTYLMLMPNEHLHHSIFQEPLVMFHILHEFSKHAIRRVPVCECWFPLKGTGIFRNKYENIGNALVEYCLETIADLAMCGKMSLLNSRHCFLYRKLFYPESQLFSSKCYQTLSNCNHKLCETFYSSLGECIPVDEFGLICQLFMLLNRICSVCCNLWNHVYSFQKRSFIKMLCLEHYVQLGIMEGVEPHLDSVSSVKEVLDLNSKIQRTGCLNCCSVLEKDDTVEVTLSWSDLAENILKKLGPDDTARLLSTYPLPQASLDKRFYQSYIISCIMMSEGLGNQNQVLDAVSNSHRISPVPTDVAEKLVEALAKDMSIEDRIISVEKRSCHHWGAATDLSALCCCCGLPLYTPRILAQDNGGIVIFSCLHAYHTKCLFLRCSLTNDKECLDRRINLSGCLACIKFGT